MPEEFEIVSTVTSEQSVSTYATVSHAKGDIGLITVDKAEVRRWVAAGGSLSAVFFSLMAGTALTLIVALKSGGIAKDSENIFWLAFWASLVLMAFFGIMLFKQEMEKHHIRKQIDKLPVDTLKG